MAPTKDHAATEIDWPLQLRRASLNPVTDLSGALSFTQQATASKGTRVRMDHFSGSHHNKLDTKGRVSVPAPFRSILKKNSSAGPDSPVAPLVLRPSHQFPCIEGWTEKGFEALSAPLEAFDQFSPEHDDLSIGLFGDACTMETDKEGRIILPAEMVAYAGLTDNVVFIGANKIFQIWEPAAGARRIAEAKARIRTLTLRNGMPS